MVEAFGLSDPGCIRTNNEDYFISDTRTGIFIVADGMGGANAGEIASRLSVETLYEFLVKTAQDKVLTALEQGFTAAEEDGRQRQVQLVDRACEQILADRRDAAADLHV